MYHGNGGEFAITNGDLDEDAQLVTDPTYARFSVKLNPHHWYNVNSSFPMKPNTWHQIVGVWEKGVSLKVYIDGVLAGENNDIPAESLYDPSVGGSWPSSLGINMQGYFNSQVFFKGQISIVMMFNKTLTAQELLALYDDVPFPSPTVLEPFPTTIVIGAVAVIAVVGLGILAYFKKFKN